MADRTFAIGDIHGDLDQLRVLMDKLPALDEADTLVFVGDYIDRGPRSAQVVQLIRKELPKKTSANIVTLRGNHEDAWLRVATDGWPEFVLPPSNGCLACLRSFTGGPVPADEERPADAELEGLFSASFFPGDVLAWMSELRWWYEDEHAIYVHAGVPEHEGRWLHPSEVDPKVILVWLRTEAFFREYKGKLIVVGHTTTDALPPELSTYTPSDPMDMWVYEKVIGIDTGCGKGGFLTAIELPSRKVYESR